MVVLANSRNQYGTPITPAFYNRWVVIEVEVLAFSKIYSIGYFEMHSREVAIYKLVALQKRFDRDAAKVALHKSTIAGTEPDIERIPGNRCKMEVYRRSGDAQILHSVNAPPREKSPFVRNALYSEHRKPKPNKFLSSFKSENSNYASDLFRLGSHKTFFQCGKCCTTTHFAMPIRKVFLKITGKYSHGIHRHFVVRGGGNSLKGDNSSHLVCLTLRRKQFNAFLEQVCDPHTLCGSNLLLSKQCLLFSQFSAPNDGGKSNCCDHQRTEWNEGPGPTNRIRWQFTSENPNCDSQRSSSTQHCPSNGRGAPIVYLLDQIRLRGACRFFPCHLNFNSTLKTCAANQSTRQVSVNKGWSAGVSRRQQEAA